MLLTVTESGFDKIPLERRAKAFTSNEGGWPKQMALIQKYVEKDGHRAARRSVGAHRRRSSPRSAMKRACA